MRLRFSTTIALGALLTSTVAGQGKIYPGVAFKKLESLVQGAQIAPQRLWS